MSSGFGKGVVAFVSLCADRLREFEQNRTMLESTRRPEVIMEVIIEHLGAVQFEIKVRGHAIVSDQPRENGGFDEGMTPPELLLASLGSCAAFYAAQYLRKHHLATEGTMVRVSAEMAQNPARLNNFRVQVEGSAGNQRPAPPRAGLAAVLNAVRV